MPESSKSLDADALVEAIRSQCSAADNALIDCVTDGFIPDRLDEEFYRRALSCRNPFVREYFLWDLRVRNTKTEYLNAKLGRSAGKDLIDLPGADEFDEKARVQAVLSGTDILKRERGLDDLMWNKADELVQLHLFDVDVILAFIAKIKITDRWNRLDPQSGRELFRNLVEEIRQTRQ